MFFETLQEVEEMTEVNKEPEWEECEVLVKPPDFSNVFENFFESNPLTLETITRIETIVKPEYYKNRLEPFFQGLQNVLI